MSITIEQKAIVQTTFGQLTNADLLASRFYARLFETDPSARNLFKGDMAQQGKKLIQTLAVVVQNLNQLDMIVPAIASLAQRHAAYGVEERHWDSVGAALLWALNDAFGEAYTQEVHDAWAAAYTVIARTAIAFAYPASEDSGAS